MLFSFFSSLLSYSLIRTSTKKTWQFIFLFSFLAWAQSRPERPDRGAPKLGDPHPSQWLVGRRIDPSSSPLSASQIIELLALALGQGWRCCVGTRDKVLVMAENAGAERSEVRAWKRDTQGVCVCLEKTTWWSLCFVFLTIYQHQAEFETPKPLNRCLTNGRFLCETGQEALEPSASSRSFYKGRNWGPEKLSCRPGFEV